MNVEPISFQESIEQVRRPKVGKDRLFIWGGDCGEADILQLVNHWPNLNDMPYRIWEYSSSIKLEKNSVPDDVQWLERGRLFGEGGDLSLRRDSDRFLWNFVGRPGVANLPAIGNPQDFWEAEPDARFHESKETALLWGEYESSLERWFDNRAAIADLIYPTATDWNRVQINYWTYSRAGRVEFVWFCGLEEYDG